MLRLRSIALLGTLGLLSCGREFEALSSIQARELTTLSVLLINDDADEAIHILAPDEPFAPSNQLNPGGGRQIALGVFEGEGQVFSAGRNGQVLTTAECVPHFGIVVPRDASVIWTGEALVCANWTAD